MNFHLKVYLIFSCIICLSIGITLSNINNVLINGSEDQAIKSGYLKVDSQKSNSSAYYLFYGPKNNKKKLEDAPIIIYLQGGPGLSSLIGNFFEVGSFGLRKLENNQYEEYSKENSWNNDYSLLFIDQPIGTGASFSENLEEIPRNQSEVNRQLYNALLELFSIDFFKPLVNNSIVIFGEGYAGKFAASIAKKILEENKKENLVLNLKGVVISGGFNDPESIVSELSMFGYNMALLDFQERIIAERKIMSLILNLRKGKMEIAHNLFREAFSYIQKCGGGVISYDFRVFNEGPIDFSGLNEFFRNETNRKRYNFLQGVNFTYDNETVYKQFLNVFMESNVKDVEYLIENNIEVLIYQGQDDLSITSPGIMRWVDNLNFKGDEEFRGLDFTIWKNSTNQVVGYYKKTNNVEFRVVNKAGHYVPFYQLNNTISMIDDIFNKIK